MFVSIIVCIMCVSLIQTECISSYCVLDVLLLHVLSEVVYICKSHV